MQLLRYFLRGVIVHLWLCLSYARQGHLRQMHVVSLGEGNVACDDTRSNGCGDALHPHESNGVLLLPDQRSRWHAFNVKTLMLPQHEATVSEHASQSR